MEALIVRPYSRRTLFMGVGSIILTACFGWIIYDTRQETDISFAYYLGGLFGLFALWFVLMGLPGSTFIRADSKGLEVRFLWLRAFTLSWPEIQEFEFDCMLPPSAVLLAPHANVVRVVLTPNGKSRNRGTLLQILTRGRLGNERGIPDIFSIPAIELTKLLNDMLKRSTFAG